MGVENKCGLRWEGARDRAHHQKPANVPHEEDTNHHHHHHHHHHHPHAIVCGLFSPTCVSIKRKTTKIAVRFFYNHFCFRTIDRHSLAKLSFNHSIGQNFFFNKTIGRYNCFLDKKRNLSAARLALVVMKERM